MIHSRILQLKNDTQSQIKDLLISLREKFYIQNQVIAARVGINANYLSGVFNGIRQGSPQLLASLKMFCELENLKKENRELKLQLAKIGEAQRMLTQLTAPAALNEPVSSVQSEFPSQAVQPVKYKVPARPRGRQTKTGG